MRASGLFKVPALSLCREGAYMAKNHVLDVSNSSGKVFVSVVGMPEPIAHPLNCKHECPYGHDRSFCFPCYAKIVAEHRAKKRESEVLLEVR